MVLVDPLAMAGGAPIAVNVERLLSDHLGWNGSLQLGWSGVGGFSSIDLSARNPSRLTGSLGTGFSYYVTGHAPNGFWVGPRMSIGYSKLSYEGKLSFQPAYASVTFRNFSLDVSALAGYTALVSEHVVLQAGVGLGATLLMYGSNPFSSSTSSGVTYGLRGLLGLGWLF